MAIENLKKRMIIPILIFKENPSNIFGYLLEPYTEIWLLKKNWSNYGYGKFQKALDYSTFKIFNIAFWLYIASQKKTKADLTQRDTTRKVQGDRTNAKSLRKWAEALVAACCSELRNQLRKLLLLLLLRQLQFHHRLEISEEDALLWWEDTTLALQQPTEEFFTTLQMHKKKHGTKLLLLLRRGAAEEEDRNEYKYV
jgi:hypothetical protein